MTAYHHDSLSSSTLYCILRSKCIFFTFNLKIAPHDIFCVNSFGAKYNVCCFSWCTLFWRKIRFDVIYAVLVQNQFCCDLCRVVQSNKANIMYVILSSVSLLACEFVSLSIRYPMSFSAFQLVDLGPCKFVIWPRNWIRTLQLWKG